MPSLSRAFIRAGLFWLLLGCLVGVLLGAEPGLAPIRVAWIHMLVVGWLTQLIFGVAYWMFPRHSAQTPRGDERLGWMSFGLLNAGLLCRVVGEPWQASQGDAAWLLALSALLQLGAALGFVINTWPRIRER